MAVEPRTDLGPFSGPEATARPWAHTVDALRRTQKFTLCTVRTDGRPHATPLLAVWEIAAGMRAGDVVTYFVRPTIIFAFGNGPPFSQPATTSPDRPPAAPGRPPAPVR